MEFHVIVEGLKEDDPHRWMTILTNTPQGLVIEACVGTGATAIGLEGRNSGGPTNPCVPGYTWLFSADGTNQLI
jgi:hypothetical protein